MSIVIILAGGMGKRMNSDKPKVLVDFKGIPMLVRLVREVTFIKVKKILIVVGKFKEQIVNTLNDYNLISENIEFIYQKETLGTGHAVLCCQEALQTEDTDVLILYGDTPLLKHELMSKIIEHQNKMVCMVTKKDEPYGCGRIITNNMTHIERIIEEKDCNELERKIKTINCGIYKFHSKHLTNNLKFLNNNNKQKEYYLTDMIEIIKQNEDEKAVMLNIKQDEQYQVIGVNTKEELIELETLYVHAHLTR